VLNWRPRVRLCCPTKLFFLILMPSDPRLAPSERDTLAAAGFFLQPPVVWTRDLPNRAGQLPAASEARGSRLHVQSPCHRRRAAPETAGYEQVLVRRRKYRSPSCAVRRTYHSLHHSRTLQPWPAAETMGVGLNLWLAIECRPLRQRPGHASLGLSPRQMQISGIISTALLCSPHQQIRP
jgi:hypothetical protein